MVTDHVQRQDIPGTVSDDKTLKRAVPLRHFANWRAILAGLVVTIATVWLLSLLGAAIGASVLDGTDGEALSAGFGIGTVIWIAVTGLAAFFIGGLVAGRLCGQDDDQAGLLHGLAMWSTATGLMLILSYWGISGLVNTGSSIVATATEAVTSTAGLMPTPSTMASTSQSEGAVTSGISAAVKSEIARAASSAGGSSLTKEEAQQAIERLDGNALKQISWSYLSDDAEAARDTLAANTNLSSQQVDVLSKSITSKIEVRVNEYRARAAEAVESASSYAQATLWTTFVSSALGLVAAILGAMLGCRTAVRLHIVGVERNLASAR